VQMSMIQSKAELDRTMIGEKSPDGPPQ
jgi:hypothetical protein